eukprot:TRINITY_DN6011_c0_g1_i1.p3 TRINITY_DN6011_c0_g1~~TRINITY_DN6011_c0_g1_i1.p3  ORF type:complete len:114 (+),score=23.44 TRINITY_DN6011_c0_g1_i1:163-504(+)
MPAGVHFKKWTVMLGKIKAGAANECKSDSQKFLNQAKPYLEEEKERRRRAHLPPVRVEGEAPPGEGELPPSRSPTGGTPRAQESSAANHVGARRDSEIGTSGQDVVREGIAAH